MVEFIPDDSGDLTVPFFEDANNALGVVGYTTSLSETKLQSKIKQAMADLGGVVTGFQSGMFGERHAYRIDFIYQGSAGRMDIACLPLKKETDARRRQTRRHALFSVWKRLEGLFNSMLVSPGDVPLVPYMIDDKGLTMIEWMRDEGRLPALPKPKDDGDTVDGEFREAEDD